MFHVILFQVKASQPIMDMMGGDKAWMGDEVETFHSFQWRRMKITDDIIAPADKRIKAVVHEFIQKEVGRYSVGIQWRGIYTKMSVTDKNGVMLTDVKYIDMPRAVASAKTGFIPSSVWWEVARAVPKREWTQTRWRWRYPNINDLVNRK